MVSYRKIVVGTDFSEVGELGLTAAAELSRRVQAAQLHVVHVAHMAPTYSFLHPDAVTLAGFGALKQQAIEEAREEIAALPLSLSGTEVHRKVLFGTPARELTKYLEATRADLVVISSHGRGGLRRLVLGSVANDVVRASPCPVLVVGKEREAPGAFRSIAAAIDLSPVSRSVLEHAVELARCDGASLRVISLYEQPLLARSDEALPRYMTPTEAADLARSYEEAVQKLVREVRGNGTSIEVLKQPEGPPAHGVLAEINQNPPDLVVVGSSGHNAWHRMIIGSTADLLLTRAKAPVLVVPHQLAPDSLPVPAAS